VFAVQDGNGDFRQAFLQVSCSTIAQVLDSVDPALLQLYNLVPVASDLNLCPAQASAIKSAYAKYEAGGASANAVTSGSAPLVKSLLGSASSALGSSENNLFLPKVPTH
jgi:hypothetical protein